MDKWPKIVFFGDSITRFSMNPDGGCFSSMVAHEVSSYYQVDIRGFTGYSSKWVLEIFPNLFTKEYLKDVHCFVMFIGHNDCWDPILAPQATKVDEFEANMRSMVEHLLTNGLEAKDIIIVTPTWYDFESWRESRMRQSKPLVTKTLEDAKIFAEASSRVGRDSKIEVIDFFHTSLGYEKLAELFIDGVHLSKTGAKLFYNQVWPEIKKKIEERHNKPLEDIWHAPPYEQRQDFKDHVQKLMAEMEKKFITEPL